MEKSLNKHESTETSGTGTAAVDHNRENVF